MSSLVAKPIYAAKTNIGGRRENQDAYTVVHGFAEVSDWHLFLLLDGHGDHGKKAADRTLTLLPETLAARGAAALREDPAAAIRAAYVETHEKLVEDESVDTYMSGTTALLLLVMEGKLVVANVGDCRIVVSEANQTEAVALSRDHTLELEDELKRVTEAGATVSRRREGDEFVGPKRIFKSSLPYPGIVVTRSLGDEVAHKLGLLADPEVTIHPLSDASFPVSIVMASDGVWDGVKNEEAIEIAKGAEDPAAAVDALVEKSLKELDRLEIDDNVTALIIRLTLA